MGRQHELFSKPPRKRPQVLMHVCDAGNCESAKVAQFQCRTCGHRSGWMRVSGVTEGKRGKPCPNCNQKDNAT